MSESTLEVVDPPKAKKDKKIKIAYLTLKRNNSGLELFIKSKVIEEFIKNTYGGDTAAVIRNTWGQGEKYYKANEGFRHPTLASTRYSIGLDKMQDNNLVINDEMLNMSFLRVVGISEGKSFKFTGLYRETDIAAIAQSINEGLKNLFKEYNTPTCYEIEVTAEA